MQHCWCPTYLLCYRRQFNATSCLLTFLHDVACSKEETLFFPWLAKKVTLPERFSADHATLMEQLKACGQALAQLKSTGDAQQDAGLLDAFQVGRGRRAGCRPRRRAWRPAEAQAVQVRCDPLLPGGTRG